MYYIMHFDLYILYIVLGKYRIWFLNVLSNNFSVICLLLPFSFFIYLPFSTQVEPTSDDFISHSKSPVSCYFFPKSPSHLWLYFPSFYAYSMLYTQMWGFAAQLPHSIYFLGPSIFLQNSWFHFFFTDKTIQ